MYLQVLLCTMHVQVCTLNRCCEHQRTHLFHALLRMCICDRCRYIYIYVCIGICIYICMYMYMYVRICMYMYPCMYVCVGVCICIHIYVYACMRVYVYMHMCICVCIYTSPYIFVRRVCMHLQVLLSTMHVQVCTLDRCCEHQRTHLLDVLHVYAYVHGCIYMCLCMCMCMCVYIYVYVVCINIYISLYHVYVQFVSFSIGE